MKRLIDAFFNSVRAFRRLAGSEAAFQQELILLLIAIPVGWLISSSWSGYALLIASILILILVEVLNTGIEATCDGQPVLGWIRTNRGILRNPARTIILVA